MPVAGTQTVLDTSTADEPTHLPVDDSVDRAFLANQARRIASCRARGQLTDFTVAVGGERFACHRLSLCAGSAFFRALFSSPMRDSSSDEIILEEVDANTFGDVLEYLSSGRCVLTPDNVVTILAAADRLAIVELRERCTRFLERNLTSDNAFAAYEVASSLSLARLKEAALRVTMEQFEVAGTLEAFTQCSAEFLEQLFCSDELRAREEQVVSALARWLAHAPEARTDAATHLLQYVRFSLCDLTFLEDEVEKGPLMSLEPCRTLLVEAYAHLGCDAGLRRIGDPAQGRSSGGAGWLRDVFDLLSPGASEAFFATGHARTQGAVPLPPESRRRRRMASTLDSIPLPSAHAHVRTIKAVCVDEEAGTTRGGAGEHNTSACGINAVVNAVSLHSMLAACARPRASTADVCWRSHASPRLVSPVPVVAAPRASCPVGLLYTGSWDNTAKKWGIRTGVCLLTFSGHKQDVIGMHLCRELERLFTCADRVRCWNVNDGSCVSVFGASTFYCAISDATTLYAAQYDGMILRFDLPAENAANRERRGMLASGAATPPACEEIRQAAHVLVGHESGVMGFDMRGDLLVSASIDSTAKAWSRSSGECVREFVGHASQLRAVQIWRDSVITGSYDQTIRQWDIETGAQLRVFQGHTDAIRAIVVGVDFMACYMWSASSDGTVRQWDLESGDQVQRLSAHDESVFAIAHADGVLYTGSADCTAKRFDLSTGQCIMTFPSTRCHAATDRSL